MVLTKFINFRQRVAALKGVILAEQSPLEGKIEQVTIHFPDGTNSLVKIRMFVEGQQIMPFKDFIALNNATPSYDIDEEIEINGDIELEIQNTDSQNSHTISVVLTILGEIQKQVN
ncbi:hypothetical protein LCGC14_2129260 [marine sediment metagenome]|uniref:Uncharacterized protein n=1 Tax=marine sediment metagenome TaxID=412755 RepID=A0A0F9E1X6_9ZZZZ